MSGGSLYCATSGPVGAWDDPWRLLGYRDMVPYDAASFGKFFGLFAWLVFDRDKCFLVVEVEEEGALLARGFVGELIASVPVFDVDSIYVCHSDSFSQ